MYTKYTMYEHTILYSLLGLDLTDGLLPMDRLTNRWQPFKTNAILSSPMDVSPKSLTTPSPKSFHHRSGLIGKYRKQWA